MTSRLCRRIAAILAGVLVWLSLPGCHNATIEASGKRQAAPAFSLNDNKDAPIQLSDYKGKVVLLNFWATWCHGCKLEIPWFMEFQDKYKRDGLEVIGVSMDEDGWKSVKPFLEEKKLNYPVVIGSNRLADQYGLGSMPYSVLIDRDGKIAGSHSGVVDKEGWEGKIYLLLGEKH
jgi:cytochrome c biogenesis protein CcmG/thiol:disulfide interchange protein DsbE